MKIAGHLQKSTQVLTMMNSLVKLPEISAVMQKLSMEMTKAGIMEEMIDDTMEMMEDDDVEEEAEEQVEKVLFEITAGILGQAGAAPITIATQESEVNVDEMQKRLASLRE